MHGSDFRGLANSSHAWLWCLVLIIVMVHVTCMFATIVSERRLATKLTYAGGPSANQTTFVVFFTCFIELHHNVSRHGRSPSPKKLQSHKLFPLVWYHARGTVMNSMQWRWVDKRVYHLSVKLLWFCTLWSTGPLRGRGVSQCCKPLLLVLLLICKQWKMYNTSCKWNKQRKIQAGDIESSASLSTTCI